MSCAASLVSPRDPRASMVWGHSLVTSDGTHCEVYPPQHPTERDVRRRCWSGVEVLEVMPEASRLGYRLRIEFSNGAQGRITDEPGMVRVGVRGFGFSVEETYRAFPGYAASLERARQMAGGRRGTS